MNVALEKVGVPVDALLLNVPQSVEFRYPLDVGPADEMLMVGSFPALEEIGAEPETDVTVPAPFAFNCPWMLDVASKYESVVVDTEDSETSPATLETKTLLPVREVMVAVADLIPLAALIVPFTSRR